MTTPPRLLIDTDAFCKLTAAGLLDDVLALLGVSRSECARLPALPAMLGRGSLRRRYGDTEADRISAVAKQFAMAPEASAQWLDKFLANPQIDPGEAQLYALAAEHGVMVLTGDKRALKALGSMVDVHPQVAGRIVTIEAALLGLVGTMDEPELRARGKVLANYDQMAKAVFGSGASSLSEALGSYRKHVENETHPLTLWRSGC